jgi:hypothetical protein
MRKVVLISVISIFFTLLLTVTVWSSGKNHCVTNIFGKTVCPPPGGTCIINSSGDIVCSPPYGGIVMTIDGRALCGPGKCKISAFGQAFCSAVQDGSATISSWGEPVCTGGCVPASESACSWP